VIKIAYSITLYFMFHKLKPPQEMDQASGL